MKKMGKWALSLITKALVIILVVLLLPFAKSIVGYFMPDITGEISVQSKILEQKLESSKRLEVTKADENGVLEAETNVIILGTVGKTTIEYRYTASIGIDLRKVIITTDNDRIVFLMPEPEILNDSIEALKINRQDLFSKAIDKSIETLLSEQRIACREQYLVDKTKMENIWNDTISAFRDTICYWLEEYGERHYEFEFIRQDETRTVSRSFRPWTKSSQQVFRSLL